MPRKRTPEEQVIAFQGDDGTWYIDETLPRLRTDFNYATEDGRIYAKVEFGEPESGELVFVRDWASDGPAAIATAVEGQHGGIYWFLTVVSYLEGWHDEEEDTRGEPSIHGGLPSQREAR